MKTMARTLLESTIYLLVYGFCLVYEILMYALFSGDYCSGTGTGASRFFRVCNETWLIVMLVADFLVLLGIVILLKTKQTHWTTKLLFVGLYVVCVVISPLIWDSPFFLTSTYK